VVLSICTYFVVKSIGDIFYNKINNRISCKQTSSLLKGHGNEADFLGFLQKLGPHRSLTPRLSESESRRLPDSASRGVAMVSRGVAIRIC
jgi:hypothetical protein